MTVKYSVSLIRISALAAAVSISLLALGSNAQAAPEDNQNSSRSNNAGALYISFVDEDSDDDGLSTELVTKLDELQTLLSSITEQIAQAEALQVQITDLQARHSGGGGAGKVNYQDLSFVSQAADEFEQRVLADSGGTLSIDLQLQLDALQAQLDERASSSSPEAMAEFASSLEAVTASLSSLTLSVSELQESVSTSLDSAVRAGYDLKANKKV